jgi:hypothetical protein
VSIPIYVDPGVFPVNTATGKDYKLAER